MFNLRFENSNEYTIFIQVDPFAGIYALRKGESIEIEADGQIERPRITIDEYKETRLVTLYDYEGYFVIRDGKRIPWTEFASNISDS